MLCSKCKKRMAVVFISKLENGKPLQEGYCITCAKDLGLAQVDDILGKMGISEEELSSIEEMSEEMALAVENGDFELGGAQTFPFLNSLMGSQSKDKKDGDKKSDKKEKKEREKEKKFLSAYCTCLTGKAREGKLDRIIGREKEIYRTIQILSRRVKNNPCFIGEPGVGKTAIAEGIAQRIVSGDVPFRLQNKELYLLDLTSLVAGTQFRGQFESRVKGLIEEIKREGNIILFIDEVHNLVGTGDSEGSMSAANILKPALSRGEVQVIGATTFGEYRKHIEKDPALERRFQPVTVNEPTIEDSIKVLSGIKQYYESFHNVKVPEEVIIKAVTMSERYITDRFLPDKAIDLLDEALAGVVLKTPEITAVEKLNDSKNKLSEELLALESVTENTDYEKIAAVKAELLKTQDEIEKAEATAAKVSLTVEDLADVIELWTGIPSEKIKEDEYGKIGKLSEELRKRIVGQDEAVDSVVRAIKLSRAGLSRKRRPASFIFVGPTGVGKTELVKALSETLFDDPEPLIRLDMSEYMEKHAVSKIVGSPPGYVGYDEAGQLTEKVRRRPYSVVLFDEIEKAHPDVMNILLQILDEGKITDSHGRAVSFENTVIVMTSNAGTALKDVGVGFNKTADEISSERAMKGLREFLRPEFLGRVGEVVVFRSLSEKDIRDITKIEINALREVLFEKGISLSVSEEALDLLANESYKSEGGARNIKRTVRRRIEDPIAEILTTLRGQNLSEISVSKENGEIEVKCV
ncbi:MAG: ATP-dependent Clp protease ATP-binding subunit [Oscillospiraceae bacterium]|nr:ATP-dependent Clp protease ATP-binding subunit [Oscillospiraceae bacterium]